MYAQVVATAPPLVAGVLFRNVSVMLVWAASVLALALHLGLYQFGDLWFPGAGVTFANPGVTASIAAVLSCVPVLLVSAARARAPAATASESS